MANTYSSRIELIGNVLRPGDKVIIGGMTYNVVSNHLSNTDGMNSLVFTKLGISEQKRENFCNEIYGHRNYGGDFPQCKHGDMLALTKLTMKLFEMYEELATENNPVESKGSIAMRKTNLQRLIERGTAKYCDKFIIAGVKVEVQGDYIRIGHHETREVKSFMDTLKITRDDINRAYDPNFVRESNNRTVWPKFPDIYEEMEDGEHCEAAYRCILFLMMREELLFGPQYSNVEIEELEEFIEDADYVDEMISKEMEKLEMEIKRINAKRRLMLMERYELRKEKNSAINELEKLKRK